MDTDTESHILSNFDDAGGHRKLIDFLCYARAQSQISGGVDVRLRYRAPVFDVFVGSAADTADHDRRGLWGTAHITGDISDAALGEMARGLLVGVLDHLADMAEPLG